MKSKSGINGAGAYFAQLLQFAGQGICTFPNARWMWSTDDGTTSTPSSVIVTGSNKANASAPGAEASSVSTLRSHRRAARHGRDTAYDQKVSRPEEQGAVGLDCDSRLRSPQRRSCDASGVAGNPRSPRRSRFAEPHLSARDRSSCGGRRFWYFGP